MIKLIAFVVVTLIFVMNMKLIVLIITEPQFFPLLFKDIYYYFKHKRYNECREFGKIRLNCACGTHVFGSGKTLDIVKTALEIYNKYDGLQVWWPDGEKFVTQRIHIISNVEIYSVPTIRFKDIGQLIEIEKYKFGPMDVTIFLLDESGAIFNSRDYKNNISPEFLNSLLQSRKFKVALYMTSQRFIFTDKILREICGVVNECKMFWRIVTIKTYDAYQLENAINSNLIMPKSVRLWLAKDKDFKSYNSYQLIEKMRKDYKPGMYLGTEEILQKSSPEGDINRVTTLKKIYRKESSKK